MNDQHFKEHVKGFLLRQWNPCVVGSLAEAKYAEDLVKMLRRGATGKQIAEFLVQAETESLGYQDTDPTSLIPLANKLIKLARTAPGSDP